MIGLLKSELYKLFTKKSFYICGLIIAVVAGIVVWCAEDMYNYQLSYYGIPSINFKQLGFTVLDVMVYSLQNLNLIPKLCAVFSSMFVCSEFSSGMIKSLSVRGKSRISIYLSKLLVSMIIPIAYTAFYLLSAYIVGIYRMGISGSWKDEYLNNGLIPVGFFVLVNMVIQSVYIMIGYILTSSAWVTAINLGIITILPSAICTGINYILRSWFGVSITQFNPYDYLLVNDVNSYSWPLKEDLASKFPWILISYFVIPILIGILVFKKKEIK